MGPRVRAFGRALHCAHEIGRLRRQTAELARVLGMDPEELGPAARVLRASAAEHEADLRWFEEAWGGEFDDEISLQELPTRVVQLRVNARISQRELARTRGVSDAAVSRDERSNYRGLTVDRAEQVLAALGYRAVVRFERLDAEAMQPISTEPPRDQSTHTST